MKDKVKIIILFLNVLVLIKTEVYPQNDVDSHNNTTVYLSAGLGYKYHFTKIDPYTYSTNEVYRIHYAFSLGVAADFWGEQRHIIGLELIGFPFVYGDHQMSPRYSTLISNIFYRRNIFLSKNILVYPTTGLAVFSNDAVQIFAVNVELGVAYTLNNYELFIKNIFRISPGMLLDTPWFLIIGCSVKL